MSERIKNYTIKIDINDIYNNIYYKDNPDYFMQLKTLVEQYPMMYSSKLKAKGGKRILKSNPNYVSKYNNLKNWIDKVLKNTKVIEKGYPEKCYWIFNNMTDYNKCQNINCDQYVTSFLNITHGYFKHCKNRSCASSDPIVMLKREKTTFKNYGVKYPAQNKEIWHKVEQTCLKVYNNKNVLGSKYSIQKGKETKFKKYGNENFVNSEKSKLTKLKKFGTVCSPSWSYVYDNISFDSSWELAYYIWLKDNNINFKYHPTEKIIKYIGNDNNLHSYTPDFWLIDDNIVIDIKGNQFFDKNGNLIIAYNNQSWKYLYDILIKNNIYIIRKQEIQKYLTYINNTYGKNYLKNFKKVSNKDII